MTDTPNLALPLLAAAQAQKHVTHNEALYALDALLQCAVIDKDLAAPPASPSDGDRYIVAAPATGLWAGQAGAVAVSQDGLWTFHAPKPGFIAFVLDEALLYFYAGSGWVPLTSALGAVQNLALLGIGTSADATNPFSAKLNKALWTARASSDGGTGDLRYTLNKEGVGNVLSLLFQTGYAARAELGLVGNDDVTLRVSPDGTVFFSGLRTNKDLHGRTSIKEAMRKSWGAVTPQPGAIGVNTLGVQLLTSGTPTATSPSANVSFYAQCPRVRYVSATAAGSSAGFNGGTLSWWRGNAASQGGFYVVIRFGFEVFQPGARLFCGLYGSASPIGNVNPSTLLNAVGLSIDAGETTLRVLANDGSGTATRTDLGPAFPVAGHELYELILSAEPNDGTMHYRVERLNAGDVATGALTADLPNPASFLTPHLWANNGATAAAVEIGFLGLYIENSSLQGSRGSIA